MTYQLENAWPLARRRLQLLADIADPRSRALLSATGLEAGWQCLEVGAGLGTMAAWMASRVGPTGRVVATDLDTRFLTELAGPNLEVREHDVEAQSVEAEGLEPGRYDLVHARALLVHLRDPARAAARLFRALRPGGWLVLEEADFAADGPDEIAVDPETRHLYHSVRRELIRALGDGGAQVHVGRGLFGLARACGLENLSGSGFTDVVTGGSAGAEFEKLTYAQLLASSGRVTGQKGERFLQLFEDPGFVYFRDRLVGVAGQKPAG